MKFFNCEISNKRLLRSTFRIFILLLACFILALGSGLFYSPLNIVAGGLTGIAIIINNFLPAGGEYLDIIIYCSEAVLILVSFIVLGKKVTLKSLLACIAYPLFLTLVLRVPFFVELAEHLKSDSTADIFLGGIIGGVLSGTAVALAFSVGGTTGGIDTIILIIKKYFIRFKESAISFSLDASIVLIGMIVLWSGDRIYYITCIVDILSALTCALVIEGVYIMRNSSVTVEIISDKWQEINNFIQNELERGSTIYDVKGGYQFIDRKVVKVVINKKEYDKVRDAILEIDQTAFVTFTISKTVLGNGFSKNNPFE